MTTEINPRIVDGEPVCSGDACPSSEVSNGYYICSIQSAPRTTAGDWNPAGDISCRREDCATKTNPPCIRTSWLPPDVPRCDRCRERAHVQPLSTLLRSCASKFYARSFCRPLSAAYSTLGRVVWRVRVFDKGTIRSTERTQFKVFVRALPMCGKKIGPAVEFYSHGFSLLTRLRLAPLPLTSLSNPRRIASSFFMPHAKHTSSPFGPYGRVSAMVPHNSQRSTRSFSMIRGELMAPSCRRRRGRRGHARGHTACYNNVSGSSRCDRIHKRLRHIIHESDRSIPPAPRRAGGGGRGCRVRRH